jgi:Phasin protein
MAQKETERAERVVGSILNPAEFAAMGKKQMDEFVKMQTELFDKFRETNEKWFDRAKSEADLASQFASKLTAARSIPEAMMACQEWSSHRFEMMAEDGKHLLEDSQKFMETGTKLVSNGWSTKSVGAST